MKNFPGTLGLTGLLGVCPFPETKAMFRLGKGERVSSGLSRERGKVEWMCVNGEAGICPPLTARFLFRRCLFS